MILFLGSVSETTETNETRQNDIRASHHSTTRATDGRHESIDNRIQIKIMRAARAASVAVRRTTPTPTRRSTPTRTVHVAAAGRRVISTSAVGRREVEDAETVEARRVASAGQVKLVQWYPGHIARAERLLKDQLKGVDAVLEVRDIRLPDATSHPGIKDWCGDKLRIVVLNRADMVSDRERAQWVSQLKAEGETRVVLTDARAGKGVRKVKELAMEVSEEINAKRIAKGLLPRPVRAAVVGYPNVGKSALINRLVGKAACASAPRPGVTRDLRWVRIGGDLDLLDAPGILPARIHDQRAASRLAMANDIGEASYIASTMAAAMIEELKLLPTWKSIIKPGIVRRFKVEDVDQITGEEFVQRFADRTSGGDVEKAGIRMLNDYRGGHVGNFCLELPPPRRAT
jgi:ribosome biogenesis GTP-binding protein YlqF